MEQQPTITIRVATAEDASEVRAVFDAAFAPLRSIYRPTGEAVARQAARAEEGTRLVAQIADRIVGTVQFAIHREHVHLIGLAVHPNYQRMGVARGMIESVVARAPSLGHDIVALDTVKETGNVPLFEKLGFRVVRENVSTCFVSERYAELHDVQMERSVD